MIKVNFYDEIEDSKLKFAVIIAKYQGKWVFCKHKERDTYEFPGGHREAGEDILTTAKRELYEETGAIDYTLRPIGVYSVLVDDEPKQGQSESFGMLYYAEITEFAALPEYEIAEVLLTDILPTHWTYPYIQPKLFEKLQSIFPC